MVTLSKCHRFLIIASLTIIFTLVAIMLIIVSLISTKNLDEIHGIRKGMTKTQVVAVLAKRGVSHVVPDVTEHVIVKRQNLHDIPKLMTVEGVCIGDNAGRSINFELHEDGSVTKLYESFTPIPELATLRSRSDLEIGLIGAFANHEKLVASSCIPHRHWVSLVESDPAELAFLMRYSNWGYVDPEPGTYSSVTLIFTNEILGEIRYQWTEM